jgi:predicted nucleic acid-binding protein
LSRASFKSACFSRAAAALPKSEPFVLRARPMGLRAGHHPAGFKRLADDLEAEAFLETTRKPRIYHDPLSVAEAGAHVHSWLGRKHVHLRDMLMDDVEKALVLLEAAGTAGHLATDAQIAAGALRLDAEMHTADLDFGRFAGVRFRNPML